jgi:HEPN domain-containing protein
MNLAQRSLDRARADLMAARNCLDGPHYLPEIAAYHCQQAAEKLVKAVLIYGIEPALAGIQSSMAELLPYHSTKAGHFQPSEHMVAGLRGAELAGKPLGAEERRQTHDDGPLALGIPVSADLGIGRREDRM